MKSHLSQFANTALEKIWMENGSSADIVLHNLNLGCDNSLRYQRYGDPSMRGSDGIHLRGRLGGQHLTESFVDMLVETFPHLKKNSQQSQSENSEN